MLIARRRTGGVLALLTFAAILFAVTVLTVAVVAAGLIVALAAAAAAFVARAVRPAWAWQQAAPPAPTSPLKTIEMTVVRAPGLAADRDLVRVASDEA
jgi:L-alanine-DL-glutamate epimerase-like enolase superfamily enzyme